MNHETAKTGPCEVDVKTVVYYSQVVLLKECGSPQSGLFVATAKLASKAMEKTCQGNTSSSRKHFTV